MKSLFNEGWYFAEKPLSPSDFTAQDGSPVFLDPCSFFQGSMNLEYKPVFIPHDWMISDTKGLYRNSVGFYYKYFELSDTKDKHFALNFEGVYMNSAVYVNGELAGIWKYGYSAFEFDISDFIFNGSNLVQVICVYQSPNTRWYSGAGIFRDVTLIETPRSYLVTDGTYITSRQIDYRRWKVHITAEIISDTEPSDLSVSFVFWKEASDQDKFLLESMSELLPHKKQFHQVVFQKNISLTKASAEETENLWECVPYTKGKNIYKAEVEFDVNNPTLWSPKKPYLYHLTTELMDKNGGKLDSNTENAGFRTLKYSSAEGLFINGVHTKIYGVCQHHDLGGLGAAFNAEALRRQFIRLHEMGVNAIRTSHNPVTRDFMNLADEMGFLIDNDGFDMWERPKTTFDYGNYFNDWCAKDTASWVRKDRNHPSLIMWSIGNEIYDTHMGNGYEITKRLRTLVRLHDPKKNAPVTIASNYMMSENAQKCAEETDVVGYNYLERLYGEHHRKYPNWKLYGSETASTVQSRGIYHFPLSMSLVTHDDRQCSTLGNCTTTWGCESTQKVITNDRDTPFSAGQFIWTGWDYIGEPTPYNNTSKSSYFGQIDTAGFPKDTYFLYKAEWGGAQMEPFVHLLPYWDWNEGQELQVKAYTNMPEVELFVNGTSHGRHHINHEIDMELFGLWDVVYHKGQIKAVAYDKDGKAVAEDIKYSFSDPIALKMTPEYFGSDKKSSSKASADGVIAPEKAETRDVCHLGNMYFFDIQTVDKDGHDVANARNTVNIEVTGEARFVSMDNGDSTDYDQYISTKRKLFGNRAVAIIRADNEEATFTVRAFSKDLDGVEVSIQKGNKVSSKIIPASETKELTKDDYVSVRKIELSIKGSTVLTKDNRTLPVTANVLPENATDRKILFTPVLPTSVLSDAVEISQNDTDACLTAVADGDFILRVTANNGQEYPEIISELNMRVTDVGNPKFNPYKLVEACRYTNYDKSHPEPKNGFTGGISTRGSGSGSWVSFDKVDFGNEGSDEISIPAFCWDPAWPLKIYDGEPDSGELLFDGKFIAEYQYNTYTEKSFTLKKRLFGVHTISVWVGIELVWHGFRFTKNLKAYSKLRALDADTIVGDTFNRTEDAVEGIGNNVNLDFTYMNFAGIPEETSEDDSDKTTEHAKKASKITICGKSNSDNNTINLKFFPTNKAEKASTQVIEFPHTDSYEERTFDIEPLTANGKISFVFLPGCNFDFKWFRFE